MSRSVARQRASETVALRRSVLIAVFVEDRETVAVALIALVTVLVILEVLAPRLEDPLEVGPTGGFKARLTKQH